MMIHENSDSKNWNDLHSVVPRACIAGPVVFVAFLCSAVSWSFGQDSFDGETLRRSFEQHCWDCHSGATPESSFHLDQLLKSNPIDGDRMSIDLADWIKVYDRVARGEMPPDGGLDQHDRTVVSELLKNQILKVDLTQIDRDGRAVWRRMNRFEYENSVRDLLGAPWLQLASMLPEDGELHRFNKLGEALDVSHVSMSRYIQAAQYALREAIDHQDPSPSPSIVRYYARQQESFNRRVHFTVFNRSAERATFPLLDYEADLEVLRDPNHPFTVGESDAEKREREAFGVVASSYEPIEIRFSEFEAPQSGRYRLRFKGYTFWAGVTDQKRYRADRENTSIGRRSEPVVIYSQLPPRQLRRLGEFDFQIEPTTQELEVLLLEGESIQPDAVRLFRSRPPNWRNPLAEEDGMPGVAFNWMEVEGPILTERPSSSQKLLFDDLTVRIDGDQIIVESNDPMRDAERLVKRFIELAYRRATSDEEVSRVIDVIHSAIESGMSFADAMIAGYSTILCSADFLYIDESPGRLSERSIANRLSLFLWNSTPDAELVRLADRGILSQPNHLTDQVDRMLADGASNRFIDAFLDYWLDLRKINDTSPDELLYPDYYLDDSLVDAALQETRLFFASLVKDNLPARNLIDSDFTYLNERLAHHYGIPILEGTQMRRVQLPDDSVRGGLLTMASVLKVTANGTTTSPVVRGAWVNERVLGVSIPAPPPSVPAIEPDTRGATTIREQLRLHRADESCNVCHRLIDPAGFALESFDVAGGYRDHYRSFSDEEPIKGFGKNGQPFTFSDGPAVDASGQLMDGRSFADVRQWKQLLLTDERAVARNLVEKLLIYATGAAPRFSDRDQIEAILDRHSTDGYPVKSLIFEIAKSRMFLHK